MLLDKLTEQSSNLIRARLRILDLEASVAQEVATRALVIQELQDQLDEHSVLFHLTEEKSTGFQVRQRS